MRNHLAHALLYYSVCVTKLLALADDVVYPGPLFSEQEEIYATNVVFASVHLSCTQNLPQSSREMLISLQVSV